MSAPERKIGHDVLMFEGEPMTRREVLIAREAFQEGAQRHGAGVEWAILFADRYYPRPVVTRPRVVAVEDQPGVELRVINGQVQHRLAPDRGWYLPDGAYRPSLSQGLVAALRSLDAEPTETVTEEET